MTHRLDPDLDPDCSILYIQTGDLAKARQEINRSPSDFASFMLVLLREGKVAEALPYLQPLPAAFLGQEQSCSTAQCCFGTQFLRLPFGRS
jgi:hypothetical protein